MIDQFEQRARQFLAAEVDPAKGFLTELMCDMEIPQLGVVDTQKAIAAIAAALGSVAPAQWLPIETAPKSSADGRCVHGHYILGFCPDPDASNLESCICVVWWEPLMNGGRGLWFGEGSFEVHPTHWQPLPGAPPAAESAEVAR